MTTPTKVWISKQNNSFYVFSYSYLYNVASWPTRTVRSGVNHTTGLPITQSVESPQVERVAGSAAKVRHDVWPVGGAQTPQWPVNGVVTPMVQHETLDATAAITARRPTQLDAGPGHHDDAERGRSRRRWQQRRADVRQLTTATRINLLRYSHNPFKYAALLTAKSSTECALLTTSQTKLITVGTVVHNFTHCIIGNIAFLLKLSKTAANKNWRHRLSHRRWKTAKDSYKALSRSDFICYRENRILFYIQVIITKLLTLHASISDRCPYME